MSANTMPSQASFERASAGTAPVQRVMVGMQYTLNAMRQWREKGPL